MKSLIILAAVALPLWVGCAGVVDEPGAVGTGGTSGGGSGGTGADGKGGAGGQGVGPGPIACAAPKSGQPGPAPLRRLTRIEYDNTVRDLLNDTSNQAAGFPEDAALLGFDNNSSVQVVTGTLATDYFEAAEALSTKAMANLDTLAACDNAKLGDDACARNFITKFGLRAFRRPITAPETTRLLASYTTGAANGGYKNGVKLVIARMLASPHFLYRPEFGEAGKGTSRLTSYEMASRLSYFLWGTMPDPDLFAAAAANKLQTPADIAAAAKRMLADGKAQASVARFHEGWLELLKLDHADKDPKIYPGFDAVRAAMKEEVTRFVGDAFWQEGGTVKNLMMADYTFMNKALATYLKLPNASTIGASFGKLPLAPAGAAGPLQRQGLLMTPGLQAGHGKPFETSPILRGKYVLEQFMCVDVPPPPGNVNTAVPVVATATTRERYVQHAKAECASCHRLMDPVGFAFENFEGDGRWRATENGKPIDPSGTLSATDVDGPFANALELTKKISGSAQMKSCLAKQWFRYAQGRDATEADVPSLQQLACAFEQGNMRDMVVGLTQTDSFLLYNPAGASP